MKYEHCIVSPKEAQCGITCTVNLLYCILQFIHIIIIHVSMLHIVKYIIELHLLVVYMYDIFQEDELQNNYVKHFTFTEHQEKDFYCH